MKRGEQDRRQVEAAVGVRTLMHIRHIMQRREVTTDLGETGGN
jgi:hypothetical protein